MRFEKGLDPIIKIFYICGLSCYPSFDEFLTGNPKKPCSVHYIPTGVLFILTVSVSICTCVCKLISDPHITSSTTSLFINTLTLMITVLVCSIRMVFVLPYFSEICAQISIIDRLSWRKFSLDLDKFRRHFMRRVYITLITFILPVVVKLYGKPPSWDVYVVAMGIATLRAIMFSILLHAFFYVDLLDHMLQSFVRHVDMRASTATTAAVQTISFRSPAAKQLTAEIFHFKLLHFNLWEVSEKVNHLFGWTIVIVFLQHFSYAIYNVYAAYMTMVQHPMNIFIYLRKSIGCFGGELGRHTIFLHYFR